jgi:hypothetical protein
MESLESARPENTFNNFFGRSPPKELVHSLLYKVMLKPRGAQDTYRAPFQPPHLQ